MRVAVLGALWLTIIQPTWGTGGGIRPRAVRCQPDAATLVVLDPTAGRVTARTRIRNLYQGGRGPTGKRLLRGLEITGHDARGKTFRCLTRGPSMDFGNLVVHDGQVLLLGDRILYPLPFQAEKRFLPYWTIDPWVGRVTQRRWLSLAAADQFRRREQRRLATPRAGTHYFPVPWDQAVGRSWLAASIVRPSPAALVFSPQPAGHPGILVLTGTLSKLDRKTGRMLYSLEAPVSWTTTGGRFPTIAYQPELAATPDNLLIHSGTELRCLAADSGQLLWTVELRTKLCAAYSFPGELYLLSEGLLVRLDPATGKRLWEQALPAGDASLARARNSLVAIIEEPTWLPR